MFRPFAAALVFAGGSAVCAEKVPSFTLSATSTNLVVTETTIVSLDLRLAPLKDPYAEVPPFLNKRAPHMSASFLEPDWKSSALVPVDPKNLFALPAGQKRGAPVFSLNSYVADGLLSSMSDPFGLFDDDDFFGRMGPKKQLFPFMVDREKDGTWHFSAAVSPQRAAEPGTVTIPPVTIEVPLVAGVKTEHDRFGRPRNAVSLSNIVLRTQALVLTVQEPPAVGRPACWCGAIASNLTVTAKLDTNVCTAGDPLVLAVDFAGAANPASVHPPEFSLQLTGGVFRVDAASAKTETLAGGRRFTWRVRPLKTGTVEFPPLSVAYYNLDRRAYVTVATESIPIQVKAGAQASLGALDETGDETDVFPSPDGIDLDPRGVAAEPLLPHRALAILLFLVPPVLFTLIRLAPPVRRRVASRNVQMRKAQAFRRCSRVLRKSFDPLRRAAAIRDFFRVRYDIDGAAVTALDAERLMASCYTSEEVALVTDALKALDAQRYSSSASAATAASPSHPSGGAVRILLALFIFLSLSLQTASAAFPGHLEFSYRRASALATRAADANGFRQAADAYRSCIDEGASNPVVYANLAGCLLMAGDANGARAAYACAERRGGETPSTARGVRAVEAHLRNDPRAEVPLTRVVFRPHLLTLDARLLIAAGAWALLWLVALLPAGAIRRLLIAGCLIVFCASAMSVTVSLAGEHLAKGVIHARK